MSMLLLLLVLIALVAGIVGVVMSQKPWQRAVALLVVGIVAFSVTQSAIMIEKKGLAAWHYGRNIRPTERLWSMVSKNIEVGRYDQAKAELMIISTNWSRIGAWPNTYSAVDILKAVEDAQTANHAAQSTSPNGADPGR